MVMDWETEDLILSSLLCYWLWINQATDPITSFVCLIHLDSKLFKAGNISYKLFAKSFFTQRNIEFSKKGEACINIVLLLLPVVNFKFFVHIEQNYQSIYFASRRLVTNFAILGGKDNIIISSHLLLQHNSVPDTQLPPVHSFGDCYGSVLLLPLWLSQEDLTTVLIYSWQLSERIPILGIY